MKVAHLVLAHKNPEQLKRLIDAMKHPSFDFFIHLDKKVNIQPFINILQQEQVFFIKKRVKVYWAGYGTIQASINGFQEILPMGYDYIKVLSAQDFPVKSTAYIYQYLADRQGKEFITCESVEKDWKEAEHRIKKYHFINWQIPGKYRLEMWANKILPERKFPLDFDVVGRSNWFTITPEATRYILDFLEKHPEVVRFFKYTWGADELIFSTILYNSPFRERIMPNLVYVEWLEKNAHPRILLTKDLEKLKTTDKLFARKFDMEIDAVVLDQLEKWIKN